MKNIQVEYGVTINLGNFESIRLSVRLEDATTEENEMKAINKLYQKVKKIVIHKAKKEILEKEKENATPY